MKAAGRRHDQMTFQERLAATLRRTLPKVGPEARAQLEALIEPQALAIMATVVAAWVASHAFGIGEVIDIIVAVIGVASIGWAVFNGIDHLYQFATGVYSGRSDADFELAADHLAKAIGILGIQAVLAVLFRGARAPRTGQGGRVNVGAAPPRAPGLRYTPSIVEDATLPAGYGVTSFYGDIRISTRGTATDRALVRLHEKVHQFLAPKLYVLRDYRANTRAMSYVRSSLYRYIEEALAETIAQVGVNGFRQFFAGVRFPVGNGYMYLTRPGGFDPDLAGVGLVPEAAALIYTGVVAGIAVELRFVAQPPPAKEN
jgi:hypothetical protein